MAKNIQAIRGMHDVLPSDTPQWQAFEKKVKAVLSTYGYDEIRIPIVEKTALFKRTIGEVTDIVEKEMYSFDDRNEESLSLRPEGTAGCVRAGLEHGLLYNQRQRLWYQGPMFRHERPQKGRYRQFHQIGVESYGMPGPDIDIEMLVMTARLWKMLGLNDLELQINTLGTADERALYRDKLVTYFEQHKEQLDEDSQRRLTTNPLRILDTKNPKMQELVEAAPSLMDTLGEESLAYFKTICDQLTVLGIEYKVNTRLVRGLDYYSHLVFEWVTESLGAQGTVCAGGRYDALVEQLGGKATTAIGFAMGMERLILLISENEKIESNMDCYMLLVGDKSVAQGIVIAERLRDQLPDLKLLVNCDGGSFKAQFKRADNSGATFAIIIGDDEIEKKQVGIKWLREKRDQATVSLDQLADYLQSNL